MFLFLYFLLSEEKVLVGHVPISIASLLSGGKVPIGHVPISVASVI